MFDEKEFELINNIGLKIASNQRDLSRKMDVSLGMVNMLIRRLITKGYIRTSKVKPNRIGYMITPKGFKEKMNQSVTYTLRTINSISTIKNRIQALIEDLYQKGERHFLILGDSDLALLAKMAAGEFLRKDCIFSYAKSADHSKRDGVVFICQNDMAEKIEGTNKVNLIYELASVQNLE